MDAGVSRCRTANSAVSWGPSPAPVSATAASVSQPGATAAAAMLTPITSVLANTRTSGWPRPGRRARIALAISEATAIALIASAPRAGPPSRCAPSSGQQTKSIPIPTKDTTEVTVARSSGRRVAIAANPAANWAANWAAGCRTGTGPRAQAGRDSEQAAGTARATRAAAVSTAARAPNPAATAAARAGPARLAVL